MKGEEGPREKDGGGGGGGGGGAGGDVSEMKGQKWWAKREGCH